MRRVWLVVGAVVLVVGVGCGDAESGSEAGGRRYRGSLTVLEDDEHGPQLCLMVMDSYPPQCSGPDVVGWDWAEAPGSESSRGTTWGDFEVTGTWDGERLTLTEPPGPPAWPDEPPVDDSRFATPCPEPPGGWTVLDPATTTQETMEAVTERARQRSDFAGLWLDQSANPALDDNDPTKLVLNVRVTGDVADAERDLRAVWGGALCVSSAEHTVAELADIRDEIYESVEWSSSGIDESQGRISVTVFVDDGLQAEYDARYGPGTVEVTPVLRPID